MWHDPQGFEGGERVLHQQGPGGGGGLWVCYSGGKYGAAFDHVLWLTALCSSRAFPGNHFLPILTFVSLENSTSNCNQDDHYIGPPVDIWALGILLYFLVTGTMPFKAGTVASLKHAILEGIFIIPSYLSKYCEELITNLLKRKPGSRFAMKQIASCAWLDGSDWVGEDKGYRPYPR